MTFLTRFNRFPISFAAPRKPACLFRAVDQRINGTTLAEITHLNGSDIRVADRH